MSLREKIMKLPLWKAVILGLLVGFIFMAGVEKLFFGKIFSVMDSMMTRFEQEKIEDQLDLEAQEKSFDASIKKWHDDFERDRKEWDERFKEREIKEYCEDIARIKSQDKFLMEMKDANYQKAENPVIRLWREERFAELEKETPVREARLKSVREMLNKLGWSEQQCDETSI